MIEFLGLTFAITGGIIVLVAFFVLPFWGVANGVRRLTGNSDAGAIAGAGFLLLQFSAVVAFLMVNAPVK